MAEHGLTSADIDAHAGGKKGGPKPGAKAANEKAKATVKTNGTLPPKYRNPKTGAKWSGHARPPQWIAGAKDGTKFLIADGAEATEVATAGAASKAKTAVKKTSKPVGAGGGKGQPKGPQPARYLDPKTGATWSGRGRAPAWLAGAKDRSKFLIDGAIAAADAKPVVTKAVAKNAPAAKKTAAKKAVSAKVPAKKAAAKSTVSVAVKKASTKNAPRKTAAVPSPVAAVKFGTESTS